MPAARRVLLLAVLALVVGACGGTGPTLTSTGVEPTPTSDASEAVTPTPATPTPAAPGPTTTGPATPSVEPPVTATGAPNGTPAPAPAHSDAPVTAPPPSTTTTEPATPTPTPQPEPTPSPTVTPAPTQAPTPPPTTGDDTRAYVIGDSTLLGAAQTVPAALAGWDVTFDAEGSRRLPQATEVLRARRDEIGRVVVIQMGNNHIEGEGGTYASQIDRTMEVLAGVERVVWLTVAEKWPSRVEINAAIRAAPQRWPQIVVAEWAPLVAANPGYAEDMLHLSAAGRDAIARLIADHVGPP